MHKARKKLNLRRLLDAVRKNKRFLITSHLNPEGDALSSELSLLILFKALGKEAVIVNEEAPPCEYDFFPLIGEAGRLKKRTKAYAYDCFVTVDCSDISRCGSVADLKLPGKTVINIDHHISNTGFGDINWVQPRASSCAEMIYILYKKLRVPLNKDAAMLLYAGMMTDTGSFRYSNTTAFTHRAVADLMRYKLDIPAVYRGIYENVPFREMKLLSRILAGLRLSASGKTAYFKIGRLLLKKHQKASFDLSEYLLSFARAVKGVEVAVIFKENMDSRGGIRVNLRSQGKIDVNSIAQHFGGGGHRTASGITMQGELDRVAAKVLSRIKRDLDQV